MKLGLNSLRQFEINLIEHIMKKLITEAKERLKALQNKDGTTSVEIAQLPNIQNPDFEVLISKKILNDFLLQNLPFHQTLSVGLENNIHISIAGASIRTAEGSQIGLQITDATFQYGQNKFRVGLHTKSVEATLFFNIRKEKNNIFVGLAADLSNLDIRFFPNWLANLIVNYLKSKWLGPLVTIEISQFLNLDYTFESEFGTVRFKKELESVAVQTSAYHIRVKAKYCD